MNKEFKNTVKFLKKNRDTVVKTIIPVVIFCLLVIIIGILSPKPNDNITPSNTYLFENRNPEFNVGFGNREYIDKSFVRFEAKVDSSNPFENEDISFWDKVKGIFTTKKQGFEFGLTEVKFDDSDSENSKNIFSNIYEAVKGMEIDDVSTDTEVIEVGRLLGEENGDSISKETVINKDVYPGIDIEYQILEGLGVKEEIVIRDIDAYTSDCGDDRECLVPLNKFVFNLRLDEGTQLKKSLVQLRGKTDTKYYITDSDDNYIAHFLPTFAVDGVGSKTTDVDLDIYQVEDRNYKVEVILNLDWLFSSYRVFPIRIDPSIVHDTTTEFDTGSNYNTEVVTGPKVQLEETEGDVVDSTVEGLWHMDKTTDGGTITVTGGTKTTDGSYTVHTFTSSGSLVVSGGSIDVEYLVVAGGGGGGYYRAGGGGAGGLLTNVGGSSLELSATSHTITVGTGGAGSTSSTSKGVSGNNSSIGSLVVATGGGGGGSLSNVDGANGGSGGGGGGGFLSGSGGTGTSGQGNDGGDGSNNFMSYAGGGGGGAGGAGEDAESSAGGDGGLGSSSSITGSSVTYSTGGDGGDYNGDAGASGSANTGNGGGGGSGQNNGGNGGSGIVVIRYLTSSLTLSGVEDYSSNSNDGTISGATHTLEGKYHGAMYFDGTDDYIEVDNDSSLQLTNDFTIALWVYRTGEGGGTWPRILSKSSASGSFDYSVQVTETYGSITEDHIMFAITKSDTNTHYVVSSRELEFNRWTHIVCTMDASNNLKVYMDGDDVSGLTDGTVGAARSTTSNLQFGRLGDSGGWHYSYVGYLDEILIMSDAISADDAARLYSNGYESVVLGAHTSADLDLTQSSDVESITWTPVGDDTGDGETVYSTTNMIGQWDFNEISGTTADNEGSCGSSCDGTLYNMTTSGQDVGVGTGWTSDNRRWGAGALMFDGSDDYVTCGAQDDFEPSTELTISAWVYSENPPESEGRTVVSKFDYVDGSTSYGWNFGAIYNANPYFQFHVSDGGTASDHYVADYDFFTSYMNKWVYMVGVYKASDYIRLYRNGELVAEETTDVPSSISYASSGDILTIGRRSADTQSYWDGVIDSVQVYSRALSSTEILSNYQSGNIEMRYRTSTDGSTWTDWSGEENIIENYESPFLYENSNDDAGTGLVSYWQLDETTGTSVDDSFGSNDGTATGTTIVDTDFSKGRDFNGSSDYVNISHSTSLNFERTDSFTLSAWIKTSSTANLNSIISKMEDSSPYRGYELCIYQGALTFQLVGTWDTSAVQKYSRTDINDGRWHYVAATYDGSSDADGINLYIDGYPDENPGVLVDNLTTTIQQTTNLRIGSRVGGGHFDGVIDEARVYNTELSRSAIYNQYEEGLVSYWKLDETSGSTATDFVGTNDGTASGTTIVDAKYGKGRSFNGSSDYIEVTNDTSLELSNNFTFDTWIYRDTDSGTYERIMSKSDGTDYDYYMQIDDNDKIMCGVHTINANGNSQRSSSSISTGEWTHVTCVFYSNYTWDVYINGEIDNGTTAGVHEPANTSSKNLQFGRVSVSSVWYYSFDGKIDDFKIYDRALTESEIQNEHLVSYWSMEELSGSTVYDVTGDDHGTATGTTIEEGKHGNARWFDGTDDVISITDDGSMDFERTDTYTLSAWFRTNDKKRAQTIIAKMTNGSPYTGYDVNIVEGIIRTHVNSTWDTNAIQVDGSTIVNDGKWHHVAVTYDGTSSASGLDIYVDGKLEDMTTNVNTLSSSILQNAPITIGARDSENIKFFNGYIDDVRVYDIDLSATTIADLYLQGSTNPDSLRTKSVDINKEGLRSMEIETDGPIIDGNTVGYWTLDETGGSSGYIKDGSGNSNDGTPSGTTYVKEGKIGGARDFNGSSDYISVSDSSSLQLSDSLTVETWFKTTTTPSTWSTLLRKDTESGTRYMYGIGINSTDEIYGQYYNGSNFTANYTGSQATDGNWHYAVATINGTTLSLYFDGLLVDTAIITGTQGVPTGQLNIGASPPYTGGGRSAYFDGMLDEVRISNVAKSPEDVLEAYNLGKYRYTSKTISSADISDDSYLPFWIASEDLGHNLDLIYGNSPYANYQPDENTIALYHMDDDLDVYDPAVPLIHWPMDETTGTTVTDIVGSNNGTASSATVATGKYGNARNFDGTDDYIYSTSSYSNPQQFTISTWFKTSTASGYKIIGFENAQTGTGGTAWDRNIWVGTDGKLYFGVFDGGCKERVSTSTVNDGNWHHAVAVLDSKWISLYVDGVKQGDSLLTGGAQNYTGYWRVGSYKLTGSWTNSSGDGYFTGDVDDVRIYDEALLDNQVVDLYSGVDYRPMGGLISEDGNYTVHTFRSNDTFKMANRASELDLLVVAGGGGAGAGSTSTYYLGGAGGAGGLVYRSSDAYIIGAGEEASVVVGSGGTGSSSTTVKGGDGGDSSFGGIVADGGGGGGSGSSGNYAGVDGGSGGGGGRYFFSYGSGGSATQGGTGGYGNNGASGSSSGGGGGGGAGSAGSGVTGGSGNAYSITGSSVTYATGGNGASDCSDGTDYEGDGGNACGNTSPAQGGDGGDGVVIVRYLTADFTEVTKGNVRDSSGSGYHAFSTGTTYMEEAKLGGGRFFDGTDDYVELDNNNDLDFTTGDFTIDLWINSSMTQIDGWPSIISKEGGSPRYGYNLFLNGPSSTSYEGPIFQLQSNGSQPSAISYINIRDGQWHHIAAVKTSSYIYLYVDGVLDASASHSNGTITQTSYPFTIGTLVWSEGHSTEGLIDEVRVSDIARSADEIRQAYEVGRRTHPVTINFRADLESSNLISSSSDTSFTISEQDYGTTDHIENIDVGQTIIVKENYGGTEYLAYGYVNTVNTSTGAVTVGSWDNGSTFPTSGFTANAIVYKWQREFLDIRYPLEEDINGISTLTFRKTNDVGTKFMLHDVTRATYSSDYAGSSFDTIEGVQYVKYKPIFSTWDDNRELDLYLSEVEVDYFNGPTMEQLMRHGKWFDSSGTKQPFWWVNN